MQAINVEILEKAQELFCKLAPMLDQTIHMSVDAGSDRREATRLIGLAMAYGTARYLAIATTEEGSSSVDRAKQIFEACFRTIMAIDSPASPAEAKHPKPAFVAGSINVSIPAQVAGCLIVPTKLLKLVEQHVKAGGACCVACHVERKLRCVAAVDAKPSAN